MSTPASLIYASRAGFVAAIRATSRGKWTEKKLAAAQAKAAEAYPITRPRVIQGLQSKYKVENGILWGYYTGVMPRGMEHRRQWRQVHQTPETLAMLQDLFENPNEVVTA